MAKIDRRLFLRSLVATITCAGFVPSPARSEAIARPYDLARIDEEKGRSGPGYWFINRKFNRCPNAASNEAGEAAIDFWEREYCDVSYADHLPPEIPRGMLWHDQFGSTHVETLEYIDSVYRKYRPNGEHQFGAYRGGIETLPSMLQQTIHDEPSRSQHSPRIALVALDSIGPAPKDAGWADILPAFARCYDHIIGHIHAPGRGLRDWVTFLNASCGSEHFEQSVWSGVSQCDVVIVTSNGLVETDPGLCPRATTEMLVGELMRRLGCALFDREVLDQILDVHRTGEKHKPRLLALSSRTLSRGYYGFAGQNPYSKCKADFDHYDRVFFRQDDIVSGCFGRRVDGERFLNIATRIDHPWPKYFSELERKAAAPPDPFPLGPRWGRTPRPPGWKLLFEAPGAGYQPNSETIRRGGVLDMITLWPFSFDGVA